jgi:glutathione-regulated potassium-efflux system ancillary protein KefG
MRSNGQVRAAPQGATGKVLVLLAHPAIHRSRVNRALARAVVELPGVTIHDLYDAYPDFDVDAAREQALLTSHDAVVFQFPFYWYSTPAILKEWQDLVLEFNFAYGPSGKALQGRPLLCALSTGGPEGAYQASGHNRFSIRELLAPLEQTANLCGMPFLPPFVVHGSHRLSDTDIAAAAAEYRGTLEALRDGVAGAALPNPPTHHTRPVR